MQRFDHISDFRTAAVHRLNDARELLKAPSLNKSMSNHNTKHLRGSMYLSGYAVECILKAYLIDMYSPLKTLADVDAELRKNNASFPNLLGSEGHKIDVILGLTDLPSYQGPLQKQQFWIVAGTWRVNMRYDTSSPKPLQAKNLVDTAANLYDWVNSRF